MRTAAATPDDGDDKFISSHRTRANVISHGTIAAQAVSAQELPVGAISVGTIEAESISVSTTRLGDQ